MATVNSPINKIQLASGSTITVTDLGATTSGEYLVTLLTAAVAPLTEDTESVLILNTDYTVDSNLTTITLTTAIDGTILKRVTVTLNIPVTQTTDFTNIEALNPENIETVVGKMTRLYKQMQEKIDRAMKVSISTSSSFGPLSLDGKAEKHLTVNATEDGFDFGTVTSISFWENFKFPSGDGSIDQVLETDGSGNLSWVTPTVGDFQSLTGEALLVYNQITDTILRSDNVSSVDDDSTGRYIINFITPITDIHYGVCGTCRSNSDVSGAYSCFKLSTIKTVDSLALATRLGTTSALFDSPESYILIYI